MRVGIAGYGLAGRSFHAPLLKGCGFEVASVLTGNSTRARQAKEDFPALMGNTRVAQNSNAKSYSCVAATPADERRLEMSRQQRVQQAAQVEAQKKAVSWADEDDSEDEVYESEEEEEVKVVVSQYGSSAYFTPSSYTYVPRATADDDDW